MHTFIDFVGGMERIRSFAVESWCGRIEYAKMEKIKKTYIKESVYHGIRDGSPIMDHPLSISKYRFSLDDGNYQTIKHGILE